MGLVHYFGMGWQEAGPGMGSSEKVVFCSCAHYLCWGTHFHECTEPSHTTELYMGPQVMSLLPIRQEDTNKVWKSWACRQILPAQDIKSMTCPAISF